MTIFYSHSKDGQGSKLLKKHTGGVTDNALRSLYPKLSFTVPIEELQQLLEDICLYHDLGKYTIYFQDYLLKRKTVSRELKQHARLGAYVLFEKLKDKAPAHALVAYYLIICHHKNLFNILDHEFSDATTSLGYRIEIFPKHKNSILTDLSQIMAEMQEPHLEMFLAIPDTKTVCRQVKDITQKIPSIQNYFLINYLFSLLIEADKLDASDTCLHSRKSIDSTVIDTHYPLRSLPATNVHDYSQNELRSYVRKMVADKLTEPDILEKRLFTLTAPTGIGKTLTALDFALKLREQIRLAEQREAQIIYGLPFINIIEQAIDVYTRVLEEEKKQKNVQILAHYQYADALEQTKNDNEEEKSQGYNQALMMLDTWQCDIVITSFVQLLQTLIGNRNKLLKKFNHFAGSIIILDEVQTIRLGLQPLIGASLYYLSKFLDARIVLMTATKPKIFDLAQREILSKENETLVATELLTTYETVFQCFRRTKIVPMLNKLADDQAFMEIFTQKWTSHQSCLIVCNTVRRSIDVFSSISQHVEKKEFSNSVYYLSTNIIPAHRLDIIRAIKEDIEKKLCPILISTQCVEAGVDLDFDMGFRDLSPIDSIVQVAGRINRNNHPDKKHSPLYVIHFGDCEKIYDKVTEQQTIKALQKAEIPEEDYLQMIDCYFDSLTTNDTSSFAVSREFFHSMKCLRYDSENKADYPVSHFKIIDEKSFAVSVFVEIDDRATICKDKFLQLIRKQISKAEFEPYKKDFNQRMIAVPEKLEKIRDLAKSRLWEDGIYWVKKEEIATYYDLKTGFIRTSNDIAAVSL